MAENQTEIGEYVDGIVFNDLEHEFRDNSVTQLREDLTAEETTRRNADTALSGRIDDVSGAVSAEVTARTNADTLLSGRLTSVDNRLSAEATARENADTALGNDITAEATARANADTALGNDITAEATARANADTALGNRLTTVENGLSAEVTARGNADTALDGRVTAIESKIPNQASAQNQLADKDFVNSSIATNTANFLGTYTTLADIEAIQNPTNNDYAFLETTDSQGNTVYDRYKYSASDSQWLFEYELNNSSFTASQWATINSGLTQSSVDSDIATAIEALDATQAGGNGKYIKAISETDGVISATEGTIDSAVTASSDNPASSDAVKTYVDTAIGALDASQAGGNGKYIKAISETDGVISATEGTIDSAVTASSNNPVSSDAVKTYVDAQVTQAIAQVLNTGF